MRCTSTKGRTHQGQSWVALIITTLRRYVILTQGHDPRGRLQKPCRAPGRISRAGQAKLQARVPEER